MGVAVMGVGICGAFPASDGLSYRELIARAATMAYQDAGIAPEEVDGAVSVEEDFVSGYSIADEYVPDQIGMALKPVYTVCGLHADPDRPVQDPGGGGLQQGEQHPAEG
jgi:acetyl-CoA C-acetyltransferase